MLEVARRLAPVRGIGPPSARKAMILRVSGSIMHSDMRPMAPLACILRIGVPINLLAVTNID